MTRRQFSTRLRRRQKFRQKSLNNIVLFLVALIPIYPAFGSYMQDYTGAVVRGQYDKSTIIDAYDGTTGQETYDILDIVNTSETPIVPIVPPTQPEPIVKDKAVEVKPSEPTVDKKKSLYPTHTVAKGETLSTIAQKYGVSVSALRDVNTLRSTNLSVNQKLLVPRINGLQHTIQRGESLSIIAQKYGVADTNTILLANNMEQRSVLSVGKTLLIPNPTKDPNKKVAVQPAPKKPSQTAVAPVVPAKKVVAAVPVVAKVRGTINSQTKISYGDYSLSLKIDKGCRSFVWGNCTCFVAKYKNVTWRGNAKDWLKNAQKQGVPTGDTPKPGAIIVYHGPGFPPAYGHVGIVMEINDEGMVIKDMNYRALNEITTRRETFDNPAIIGYIYVD